MMPRHLGLSGVTDFVPASIDSGTEQQLREELKDHGLEVSEDFVRALEHAIGVYRANQTLAENSKQATVRANLDGALNAALNLNDRLNGFDGNSRYLVGSVLDGGIPATQRKLGEIINAFSEATHLLEEYKHAGRPHDLPRFYLALDVANAIERHLGVTPSSTREGPFEGVLAITLEFITGKEAKAPHELVRRAIKHRDHRVEQPGGLVEYHPPDTK